MKQISISSTELVNLKNHSKALGVIILVFGTISVMCFFAALML